MNPEIIINSELKYPKITIAKDRITYKFRDNLEKKEYLDMFNKFVDKAKDINCDLTMRGRYSANYPNQIDFKTNKNKYTFRIQL